MNIIFLFNLAAFVFFILAGTILTARRKKTKITPSEFAPLLMSIMLYAFVTFSNSLEHLQISNVLDPLEDIAEVLFSIFLLFFIMNWRKQRTIEAIREQETWLRVTLESIADGVVTTDRFGNIRQMNKMMEEFTGWNMKEAIGKNPDVVLAFVDRKTGLPIEYNPFDQIISGNKAGNDQVNFGLMNKKGKTFPVCDSTAAIRSENEELLGTVGIFRDMTEYENMQDQLTHVHKMEAIGQLAGGVAHDFNNMLGGIIGAVDLLKSKFTGDEKKKYEYLVNLMLESAERAADLTSQLLAFSRKGKVLSSTIDLCSVAKNAFGIAERAIDKSLSLKKEFPAKPVLVVGDPSQLQNAILNLILNARDAVSQDGKGVIEVKIGREYLDESSELDVVPGVHAFVSVRDNGCGISEETRLHIFEPFYTTKEEGKGTGLGLAAVYGTVNSHHGAIDLQSKPGEGSTFTIYLPCSEWEDIQEEKVHKSCLPQGQGTVLVIEDEPILQKTTCLMLEEIGYDILLARDGIEGLSIYRENRDKISVVLLDMVMPKKSGKDIYDELVAIDPGVKIIMTSGFSQQKNISSLNVEFIKKPFRRHALAEVLQKVIDKG